jgi:hypothetical protein
MGNGDGITTDDSRWPIVVHSTIGVPSEDDVDAFLARADTLLARGALHAVVFDSSRSGRVTRYMRRRSLEWVQANKGELEHHCVCKSLVIRSAALRFVMTAVMLVTGHGVREEVFESLDEAIAWSRAQLEMHDANAHEASQHKARTAGG